MSSENEQQPGRNPGRHAAPRQTVRGRIQRPVGRAIALTAMPTALLMGTLTPKLAFAADASPRMAPKAVPASAPEAAGANCTKGAPGTTTGATTSSTTGTSTPASGGAAKAPGAKTATGGSGGGSSTPTPRSGSGGTGGSGSGGSGTSGGTATGGGTGTGGTSTPTPSPSPSQSSGSSSGGGLLGGLLGGILGGLTTTTASTPAPSATPSASPSGTSSVVPLGQSAAARSAATPSPSVTPSASATANRTPSPSSTPSSLLPTPSSSATPSASASSDPNKQCDVSRMAAPLDTSVSSQLAAGTMPVEKWTLHSSDLKLINTEFHGVVTVPLADGSTERVLKFTAEAINIGDLDMSANQRGQEVHVKGAPGSTSTMRGGTVTMYVTELKGTLLAAEGIPLGGIISVDLTPDTLPQWLYNLIGAVPIPLTLEFGNVTAVQQGQFGGNLTIPGMHLYYTPLGQ